MRFQDQKILITGAASGFGKLLAQKLAVEGAQLVLGDINVEALEPVAQATDARFMRCDVSVEADQKALVDLAVRELGGLDIAVNNAGLGAPMKPLHETTEADMDLCFAVNAKGVLFGMKHQIPAMMARGGSVLNVSSVAGINAAPKLAAYSAAKHAVIGLTKTAAAEYARKGVRVNAICPFYSPTPLVTNSAPAEMQEFLAQASPMRRLATPDEVVTAMMGMMDPESTYLTGQALAVDGGVMAL